MLCGGAVLMMISLALGEQKTFVQNLPLKPEAVAAWACLAVFSSLVAFSACLCLLAHDTHCHCHRLRPCERGYCYLFGSFFSRRARER